MAQPKAATRPLTEAELLVLGLVAERPRHGYELDREIERRGLREWTRIGFSSLYFVLGKLERAGLVRSRAPAGAKARKTVTLTAAGRRALVARTREALSAPRPTHPALLLGMLHWPALAHAEALDALRARAAAVEAERARLEQMEAEQQPLPDHVTAIFDFSAGQLATEAAWIARTIDYMATRPRLE